MEGLVVNLEQRRSHDETRLRPEDQSYLLALLANAHTELGNWDAAERANLLVTKTAHRREYLQLANKNLAGICARRGEWPRALSYYFMWAASDLLQVACPMALIGLAWLIMWHTGLGLRLSPRWSRRTILCLMLICCLPIAPDLYLVILLPIISQLLTGNAGSVLVSHHVHSLAALIAAMLWDAVTLSIAFVLWKRRWFSDPVGADIAKEPAQGSRPLIDQNRKPKLARISMYGVVVLLGLFLTQKAPITFLTLLQNSVRIIELLRHGSGEGLLWLSLAGINRRDFSLRPGSVISRYGIHICTARRRYRFRNCVQQPYVCRDALAESRGLRSVFSGRHYFHSSIRAYTVISTVGLHAHGWQLHRISLETIDFPRK